MDVAQESMTPKLLLRETGFEAKVDLDAEKLANESRIDQRILTMVDRTPDAVDHSRDHAVSVQKGKSSGKSLRFSPDRRDLVALEG